MPGGNSIADGQFIDRNVRKSVDAALQKKGYRKIEDGAPSFFVAYHTDAAGVVSQDKYGVYSWWSWGYVDYYGTKYRKQGVLVLDVRDAKHELVWRGFPAEIEALAPDLLHGAKLTTCGSARGTRSQPPEIARRRARAYCKSGSPKA